VKTMTRGMLALALSLFASRAAAQQPAPALPPLTGQVRSMEGIPLADAEVRVDGAGVIVHSDARGAFAVPNVSKGIHSVSVRRIGYLPAVATVDVPQANGPLTVTMVRSRVELDSVKVTAHLNVLGGVVVDERNRPVPGASVGLIGSRAGPVTTGDDGWFTFTAVRSGPAVLHVLKPGFAAAVQSVRLLDWRGVVVHMTRLDSTLSPARQSVLSGEGNNAKRVWLETQTRLDRRNPQAVVVTREELAPLDDLLLGDAINRTPSAINLLADFQRNRGTACVLLDGYRTVGQVPLNNYDTDDVEFVELYPPGVSPPHTVATYLQNAGCSVDRSSPIANHGILYAVIWLKN
jgi:hypothetical protein